MGSSWSSSAAYPPIDLNASLYPQDEYWCRVRGFLHLINPRWIAVPEADVELARARLQRLEANVPASSVYNIVVSENAARREFWNDRSIVQARVHPDTGKEMPRLLTLSGFIPANIPIALGMLTAPATPGPAMFWQVVNQSYNALFNYANRNATVESSTRDLAMSYGLAVSLACGTSYGLNSLLAALKSPTRPKPLSPGLLRLLGVAIPYCAVATAGALSAAAMRAREAVDGVDVYAPDGERIGTSVSAGRVALSQVMLTRVVLPLPMLLLPPLMMHAVETRTKLFARHPRMRIPMQVLFITLNMIGALPCAVALFPQRAYVDVTRLEPEFHTATDGAGKPVKQVYFNKGI